MIPMEQMETKEVYLITWYDGNMNKTELLHCTDKQLQEVTSKIGMDIQTLLPLHHDYVDSNQVDWIPQVFNGVKWFKVRDLPVFDLKVLEDY